MISRCHSRVENGNYVAISKICHPAGFESEGVQGRVKTGLTSEEIMKFALGGASSAALIVGLFAGAAFAQQATAPAQAEQAVGQPAAPAVDQVQPPAEEAPSGDRVVITGSMISGAFEDAPLPVRDQSDCGARLTAARHFLFNLAYD